MASNVSLRALRNGYDINYAVKIVVNSKTEQILKSLTNPILSKGIQLHNSTRTFGLRVLLLFLELFDKKDVT